MRLLLLAIGVLGASRDYLAVKRKEMCFREKVTEEMSKKEMSKEEMSMYRWI